VIDAVSSGLRLSKRHVVLVHLLVHGYLRHSGYGYLDHFAGELHSTAISISLFGSTGTGDIFLRRGVRVCGLGRRCETI